MSNDIVRNNAYNINIAAARLLVILHLKKAIEDITETSMKKRRKVEQNRPLLFTDLGCQEFTALQMNHGIGNLQLRKHYQILLNVITRVLGSNQVIVSLTPSTCCIISCWCHTPVFRRNPTICFIS